MSLPKFKRLNSEIYNNNKHDLNGIYKTSSSIMIPTVGIISSKTILYFKDGKIHNDDGPAMILEDLNGNYKTIVYYINHQAHRDEGPAKIKYEKPVVFENGQFRGPIDSDIGEFCSYHRGLKHCLTGPAHYDEYGSPKNQYYIYGLPYSKNEWLNRPEVILVRQKEDLKRKMKSVFGEDV